MGRYNDTHLLALLVCVCVCARARVCEDSFWWTTAFSWSHSHVSGHAWALYRIQKMTRDQHTELETLSVWWECLMSPESRCSRSQAWQVVTLLSTVTEGISLICSYWLGLNAVQKEPTAWSWGRPRPVLLLLSGVGDGQGGLACCDAWGCKESDWSDLIWSDLCLGKTGSQIGDHRAIIKIQKVNSSTATTCL